MRLIRDVSHDEARLNRNGHAANLGEYVKRNEETLEPGTHRGLAVDRLFHLIRSSFNVLGVEMIEDFEYSSELWLMSVATIAAFNARSEAIVRAWILGGDRASGPSGDESDCSFHDLPQSRPVYQASSLHLCRSGFAGNPFTKQVRL